jgi:hypothetical protein
VAETVVEVEGRLLFGPPKTRAGRRRIGLPRRVVEELALQLWAPGRPTDPVFRSPAGGPLRVTAFRNRIWRPATVAAGLSGLRIHYLRHTAVAFESPPGPLRRRSPCGPGIPRRASCWTSSRPHRQITAIGGQAEFPKLDDAVGAVLGGVLDRAIDGVPLGDRCGELDA